MKKERILAFILSLALVLGLAACGGDGKSGTTDGVSGTAAEKLSQEPSQRVSAAAEETKGAGQGSSDELVVAMTKDENTLTPFTYVTGTPGFDVMRFLYDSLFTIDANNEAVPWMVEDEYTVNEDFTEFTVTLKDGQKWHDGEPVTAEDVKFTFDYVRTQSTGRWITIASAVKEIAVSGNEITFTLAEPNPSFIRDGLADMRIIAKHKYDGVEDGTTVDNMGSGPYRLAEYVTGEYYTLEAVDDYFRGTATVKIIRMPIVTDSSVTQQMLLSGEIAAFTGTITPEVVDTFEAAEDVELLQSEGFASTLLLFNCERAPFDNAKFRTALSQAINLDELVKQVYLGMAEKGTAGHVKEGLAEYVAGLDYVYDVDGANALLDELGYTERDGDGMRLALDGAEMDLEFLVYSGSTLRIRMAEIISMQFEKIGVRATVTSLDADTVDAMVWPGFDVASGRDFDLSMWGWSAPVVQKSGVIITMCDSDPTLGGDNLGGYVNPDFDALAAEYLASSDTEFRRETNEKLQRMAAADTPFVTLLFSDNISAVNTSAYDGWVAAAGTCAFNVFSFLPQQ